MKTVGTILKILIFRFRGVTLFFIILPLQSTEQYEIVTKTYKLQPSLRTVNNKKN